MNAFEIACWFVLLLVLMVAELVAMQRQMRLKENLAALGELTAGIAHEFKNALGAISAYAQMIQEDASQPDVIRQAGKILRERRADCCPRSDQTIGRNRRPVGHLSGQWTGHSARGPGQDLFPVFHHQGERHRPGTDHRAEDHRPAPRHHRGSQPSK